MNRTWHVQRETVAVPDGQRRWDRAYQLVLRWAEEGLPPQLPHPEQENNDADCPLCPGFDHPATADAHH